MKKWRFFGWIILCAAIMFMPSVVSAADNVAVGTCEENLTRMLDNKETLTINVASGTCGENLTWTFDNKGTLTISGKGAMEDYDWYYEPSSEITNKDTCAPWYPVTGSSITTVIIEEGVTTIGDFAFQFSTNLLRVTMPDSLIRIGSSSFSNCYKLTNIVIPKNVTSIGSQAFRQCSRLSGNVTIPEGVTSIESCTFFCCSKLRHVTMSSGITSIGAQAFYDCVNLTDIVLPDGLTHIGQFAFFRCGSEYVYIPKSVTRLDRGPFFSCYNLTDVHYGGSESDWKSIYIDCSDGYSFHLKNANIHYNSIPEDIPKYKVLRDGGYEIFDCSLEACMKKKPPSTYNPQLAHMLIAMCNSVFNETDMQETFARFGFEDSITNYNMGDGIFLGYGMAKKKMDNGKTLMLVVTRGSTDAIEWVSNFDARIDISTGQHIGFSDAANALYNRMADFLGTTDFSNTNFVITGFSRGAAAANILARRLVDEKVAQSQIYAYTFACPDVGLFTEAKVSSYNCIYNIADAEDFVSWVPRTLLGNAWNKFGHSRWYSNIWEDYENLEMCLSAHNQASYLEYLRDEKSISEYKNRNETKGNLDDAAVWRRNKFFTDVGKNVLGCIGIHCPVDVEIYASDGRIVGSIKNNLADNVNIDKIHISIIDDEKDIYLLDNDVYTLNLTASGDGTMEYSIQNIRVSDQYKLDSKIYANVSLTEGKQMISTVQTKNSASDDTDIDVSGVHLFVLGDDKTIEKEVLVDGSGTEIVVDEKPNESENPDEPGTGGTTENPSESDFGNKNPDEEKPGDKNPSVEKPDEGNSGDKNPSGKDKNEKDSTVKVKKITISGISMKIAAGKKITLNATVTPSNAANKSVTWKSSNTKYATVNSQGIVKLKKAGKGKTVTITAIAKDGSGKKSSYKIKIMKGVVKKVTIAGKTTHTAKVGTFVKLKAVVKASNGANKNLKWTSSNEKYASVNGSGKVTLKKAGKGKTVRITAMATDGSGKKAAVKIKIK